MNCTVSFKISLSWIQKLQHILYSAGTLSVMPERELGNQAQILKYSPCSCSLYVHILYVRLCMYFEKSIAYRKKESYRIKYLKRQCHQIIYFKRQFHQSFRLCLLSVIHAIWLSNVIQNMFDCQRIQRFIRIFYISLGNNFQ